MKNILIFLFLQNILASYVVDMSLSNTTKINNTTSNWLFVSLDDALNFLNENEQNSETSIILKKNSSSYIFLGSSIIYNAAIVPEDKT